MPTVKRPPFMKWYARDWRGDGALRMCSLAARGLWADLLSLMHDEGEPYGHLMINGVQPASASLGRMLGAAAKEIDRCIGELEKAGVLSRLDDGTIYSRRMVRDKAKADLDRENGKGGGNPKLKGEDNAGVNPPVKTPDKTHIPDTRVQIPTKTPDPDFEAWYAAYPKRTAKGAAIKAYRTARKKADVETLLAGAKAAARKYAGTQVEYVPYPATWLNGERWLDETPRAQPASSGGFNL